MQLPEDTEDDDSDVIPSRFSSPSVSPDLDDDEVLVVSSSPEAEEEEANAEEEEADAEQAPAGAAVAVPATPGQVDAEMHAEMTVGDFLDRRSSSKSPEPQVHPGAAHYAAATQKKASVILKSMERREWTMRKQMKQDRDDLDPEDALRIDDLNQVSTTTRRSISHGIDSWCSRSLIFVLMSAGSRFSKSSSRHGSSGLERAKHARGCGRGE